MITKFTDWTGLLEYTGDSVQGEYYTLTHLNLQSGQIVIKLQSLEAQAHMQKRKADTRMTRIFCFGDSNTYGYDACSMYGNRLPKTQRWTDILQQLSGWEVINKGLNGRKIPKEPWSLERFDQQLSECGSVDLVFVMLGTNDLLGSGYPDMERIGTRMDQFARHVLVHPAVEEKGERFLLAAPPPISIGRFRKEDSCYDREAEKFGDCYRKIAASCGLRFADTGGWGLSLAHDGIHLSPKGHRSFAKKLWELLSESGFSDSGRLQNMGKRIESVEEV